MDYTVIKGDIAEKSADALVCSAGTSLRMGSGVAGALREAGGEEINQEAVLTGPIPVGSAIDTNAGDLDAEYVIHAVAMPHYGNGKATIDSIQNATRAALEVADVKESESIVIPAIGCGIAGIPLSKGIKGIAQEIQSFSSDTLEDIRLIGYSSDEYETISEIVEQEQSPVD